MDKITLGNKTFEISRQAKFVLYAWIVIIFMMLIMLLLDTQHLAMNLLAFIMYVLVGILSVYAVNCYVVGNCNVLAWIATVFSIFTAVMYVFTTLMLLISKTARPSMKSKKSMK
jgi:hypothetical protein